MSDPRNTDGAPPREIHVEKKRTNWLAWLLLLLGILALLLALARCGHKSDTGTAATTATVAPATTPPANAPQTPAAPVERVVLPGGTAVELKPRTLNYDLQAFLASNQPAPRTFTFDKLNFDTASSEIRADDQPTLKALGQILQAYPKAKVALTGYADARGSDPKNDQLGAERAKAVAAALSAEGVDAGRITTASGGAGNPVAPNDTASGQFANRRTELTVSSK